VFLDAKTAQLLHEHRKTQVKARIKAGEAWQDHDLVFCQADGRPWLPDHVSKRFKRFKRLAAQAGVPAIKLHEGGRHTGNSLMRDAGVDQKVRMREVGHADKTVNDRYTHVWSRRTWPPLSRPRRWSARRGAGHDLHGCPTDVLLQPPLATREPGLRSVPADQRVGRVGLEPTTGGL
jgi:hypothetical protein